MVSSALSAHAVHAALVAVGLLVLAFLLRPAAQAAPQALAVAQLKRHARDGRLVELAQARAAARPASPRELWVAAAAVGGVAAGWIHALVAGEHLAASAVLGGAFVALALAQTAWAVALLRRPTSRLLLVGILAHALVAVVWLISRTSGLPGVGVEPVGVLDGLATAYELMAVLACLAARRTATAVAAPATSRQRRGIALAASGTVLLVVAGL